jgi:CheY-like chemotaxis protein
MMISVLVVDDMPDNLRLMRKLLQPEEFRLREAPKAEEALSLAAQEMPDIMLVDLRLGEGTMTGYDLAKRVRVMPGGRAAVIIALSGGAVLEDDALSRETGFDDFILKPFAFASFTGRLKALLAAKREARP